MPLRAQEEEELQPRCRLPLLKQTHCCIQLIFSLNGIKLLKVIV